MSVNDTDVAENGPENFHTVVFFCGVVAEILSAIGFVWTLLLLLLLMKYSNSKIFVSYVPIISFTLSTLGNFSLLTFDDALELLGVEVWAVVDIITDFLFFPFWYGLMTSVCLLAINRVSLCMNFSLTHALLSNKWMMYFIISGWIFGCTVGVAALCLSAINDDDEFLIKHIYSNNHLVQIGSKNVINNYKNETMKINYILIITQSVNCLTILSVLVCYIVVMCHVRKRRRINDTQPNDISTVATNPRGYGADPRARNKGVYSRQPSNQPSTSSSTISEWSPLLPKILWSITLHFFLISSSVGSFGVFILVGKLFSNPCLILAQFFVHVFTSLINVFLITTINGKIKKRLLKLFRCNTVTKRCRKKPEHPKRPEGRVN